MISISFSAPWSAIVASESEIACQICGIPAIAVMFEGELKCIVPLDVRSSCSVSVNVAGIHLFANSMLNVRSTSPVLLSVLSSSCSEDLSVSVTLVGLNFDPSTVFRVFSPQMSTLLSKSQLVDQQTAVVHFFINEDRQALISASQHDLIVINPSLSFSCITDSVVLLDSSLSAYTTTQLRFRSSNEIISCSIGNKFSFAVSNGLCPIFGVSSGNHSIFVQFESGQLQFIQYMEFWPLPSVSRIKPSFVSTGTGEASLITLFGNFFARGPRLLISMNNLTLSPIFVSVQLVTFQLSPHDLEFAHDFAYASICTQPCMGSSMRIVVENVNGS
jgi:hypothetical protein